MTMHPLAQPFSRERQARAHRRPQHRRAAAPRVQRVARVDAPMGQPPRGPRATPSRCRCCPATAPAGRTSTRSRWTDWYAEAEAALDRLLADLRRGGRGGRCRWAGRWRCGWPRSAAPTWPAWCWSTRSSRATARSCVALPVLKRVVPSLPGVVNDIKKPGEDEVGYHRLPLKGARRGHGDVEGRSCPTCRRSPSRCSTSGPARTTSSTTPPAGPCSARSARATARSGCSTNSYHVATLDHEAEIVFAESADFVARVTA